MRARNKYYKLDEVEFVGVQKSRTPAEIRMEAIPYIPNRIPTHSL
jgi:hypothetical protein